MYGGGGGKNPFFFPRVKSGQKLAKIGRPNVVIVILSLEGGGDPLSPSPPIPGLAVTDRLQGRWGRMGAVGLGCIEVALPLVAMLLWNPGS